MNHPVGRAIILRDRGLRALTRPVDAAPFFQECYRVSKRSGSHLTAIKALIGYFHAASPIDKVAWITHVAAVQGSDAHTRFFQEITVYLDQKRAFRAVE